MRTKTSPMATNASRSDTEPGLGAPVAPSAHSVTAPPTVEATLRGVHAVDDATDPGPPPNVSTTDPGRLVPAGADDRDALVDALRGLRQAQEKPWAPRPKIGAASDGADFAAHAAVNAPLAARHEAAPDANVVVEVTAPPGTAGDGAAVVDVDAAIRTAEGKIAAGRSAPRAIETTVPGARRTARASLARPAGIVLICMLAAGGPLAWWLSRTPRPASDADARATASAAEPTLPMIPTTVASTTTSPSLGAPSSATDVAPSAGSRPTHPRGSAARSARTVEKASPSSPPSHPASATPTAPANHTTAPPSTRPDLVPIQ